MPSPTPVLCVETGIVYPSMVEAGRAVFVTANTISHALRNGHRAAGYVWKYADGRETPPLRKSSRKPRRNRTVVREDGVSYQSAKVAAKANNLAVATIYCALTKYQRAGGYWWRYAA